MNQLVFKNNNQAVTSSRNVARDFDKQHRHVLEAIDAIKRVAENWADLFFETTYIHEQNKQEYRQYLMNRDGFTLLVMGFTGKAAMKFKLDYMNAFNEMEKELQQPRVLSDKEQLMASLKLTLEASEAIEQHNERITSLEETMRIDGSEEFRIRKNANRKIMKVLGGKESPAYKELNRKVFSNFWRDFKDHFTIPRYGDLPKKQFDQGVRFIELWQPSTSLLLEIENANNQQTMQEVI
ncbi:Rha family transcriptional regulator [Virgibacillus dokdonensis]|uniref:ORF6C domain-containing protein n=1 Tax=Virgibacillus dokdonensis TaxID=302167 RepID=A0ABU7VHF5_9BACI